MYFPHTTWVTPMHVLQYMLESMYLSWRIICQKATQEQHMAAFSGSYKLYTNCSFHKLKYVFASSVPCQYIDEHALHSGPCHLGFLTSVLLCLKASYLIYNLEFNALFIIIIGKLFWKKMSDFFANTDEPVMEKTLAGEVRFSSWTLPMLRISLELKSKTRLIQSRVLPHCILEHSFLTDKHLGRTGKLSKFEQTF